MYKIGLLIFSVCLLFCSCHVKKTISNVEYRFDQSYIDFKLQMKEDSLLYKLQNEKLQNR